MALPSAVRMGMSKRTDQGFSLIELMIVIALIAVLVAIAAPNLFAARRAADETRALAMLRNITAAQAQFRQNARADTDDDGAGEYGGFLEMAGTIAGRQASPLTPAVLTASLGMLNAAGEARRGAYFFRVFLPDANGAGVAEPTTGFSDDGSVSSDNAETVWCCYAWPINAQGTDNPTYFTNQSGVLLATRGAAYGGSGGGPAADAAFATAGSILTPVTPGTTGSDGNVWVAAD